MAKGTKEQEDNYCTMQFSKSCSKKKGIQSIANFYSCSESNVFYKNKKFNICKDCVKEYVYSDNKVDENKFKNILRIFDLPFYQADFVSAANDDKETIGVYMKNVYLNKRHESWLHGDNEDTTFVIDDDLNIGFTETELVERWGLGWDLEDLQWLEKCYHGWEISTQVNTLAVKKMIRMICQKELDIRKARQLNKPTDKLEKALLELMNNSNLTPKTMSAINETDSTKIYGVWIKDIEKYKPAEYFKDKDLYFDFDGIKDYFDRFILRPMKNILTGSRDFDSEFMIEDEDETYEGE